MLSSKPVPAELIMPGIFKMKRESNFIKIFHSCHDFLSSAFLFKKYRTECILFTDMQITDDVGAQISG
jgi:hypothetical protein